MKRKRRLAELLTVTLSHMKLTSSSTLLYLNIKRFPKIGFRNISYLKHEHVNTARPNYVINIVPQQEAWVVERFGKFYNVLSPGLTFLIPIIYKIRYVHSLKEIAVNIPEQSAITNDNVILSIDGVLFYQVIDAYKASYQIEDHEYAIKQLAQTTMRSEIGKLDLDEVFKERAALNQRIVESIRTSTLKWGVECMRYEIRDVQPPTAVLEAMQMQVEAERKKRAAVLESEGLREAAVNKATGEAQAIRIKASSRALAIKTVAEAMGRSNSNNAVSYTIAEQYISAFEKLAKESNTVILPNNLGDIPSAVAQAMAIYGNLSQKNGDGSSNSNNDSPNLTSDPLDISQVDQDSSKSCHKTQATTREESQSDLSLFNSPTFINK